MLATPAAEEFNAVKEALAQALRRSDALVGELRMVRAERDLLRERLNQSMRKLFAARSEASSAQQRDLFFNEADPQCQNSCRLRFPAGYPHRSDISCLENLIHITPPNSKSRRLSKRGIAARSQF